MLFENKVTPAFASEVKAIAKRLGLVPDYLMAVMAFESNFSPSVKNPKSTATGLIQFMESTAKGLGTTTALLAQMDAVKQLAYVEKYYASQIRQYGVMKTLTDTYLAVFYPAAIGKPETYKFTASVSAVNGVFDMNHDGTVTKQEILDFFTNWVKVRGGVIDEITKYNPVYNVVTGVGVLVMVSFFVWKKYYKH